MTPKAKPLGRFRRFVPRTIGQIMVLVAVSGLGFTALAPRNAMPQPGWKTFRARATTVPMWVTPAPGSVASIDKAMVHPAPEAIDPGFIALAPDGIDDGMIVSPDRLRQHPVFPSPGHSVPPQLLPRSESPPLMFRLPPARAGAP